jgi:hypothetical protein
MPSWQTQRSPLVLHCDSPATVQVVPMPGSVVTV